MVSSENSAALSYAVPEGWTKRAHVDAEKYKDMYDFSVSEPDNFWDYHGKRIEWIKPFTKVKRTSFDPGNVSIKWFEDGTTNVASNCIDRHLAKRSEQIAIIWEGDDPSESKKISYRALHDHVCRFANVLRKHGVEKGDTVTIYLPMIPEAAYAMLARALERFTPSSSAGFRRMPWPAVSKAASQRS